MNQLQVIGKNVVKFVGKESPTILVILGSAGMITTLGLAIEATPKALFLIDELTDRYPAATKMDKIKVAWKVYIPTALATVLTLSCFVGAHKVNMRRNAAIASLYTVTEAALKEYQEKVVEQIGERKEEKLRAAISQDKLDAHPTDGKDVIIFGSGPALMFDELSGRYFRSDMETVRRCVNDFNETLFSDMMLPLNEFYDLIGLEPTVMGRDTGWATEYGIMRISYAPMISKPGGEPCICISFKNGPRPI